MKVVKIVNNALTNFVFVPYGMNFAYVVGGGDTLEFKSDVAEQQLYYKKQATNDVEITIQNDFDVEETTNSETTISLENF